MQHVGLQYGQGAANSHQSPPFAHADISQTTGGNTTSSLRQFRKKDGTEKSGTDLNASVDSSHIARVPPHNHYPARPTNEYYRYQQYPDYNSPFKETPTPVKYSEIAETPQHVDIQNLQKPKEVHKEFMDMCNISQQTHMKQNYPDNLARQQSYPPPDASVHHQYIHKEPQVHGYKPESQYPQYQLPKYNMPSQCRKYPPPPENDFLTKLQRINPSMARSIMSDHHIRESQAAYPPMDQARAGYPPQGQRYYPLQNNMPYNYQYNYPSCNYKHDYGRPPAQMGAAGGQYALAPQDRSVSPRNMHLMNYNATPQKISPASYAGQYNPPEYAQHYQHKRTSLPQAYPQDYYQQTCRPATYMGGQMSPENNERGGSSGGLRHFIENWAEEEGTSEITPLFKDTARLHGGEGGNEQVFFINSSENVSLVPTENGQFILKTSGLDNSVVRIKETTENNGEKTLNLQIVEAQKADGLVEDSVKESEECQVPLVENQIQSEKYCDEETKTNQTSEETEEIIETVKEKEVLEEKGDKTVEHAKKCETEEATVIVSNEVSVIKDMPLIDDEATKREEASKKKEETLREEEEETLRNEEEVTRNEEEVTRKEEEVTRKEEEVTSKGEEVTRKEKEITKNEEETRKENITRQEEEHKEVAEEKEESTAEAPTLEKEKVENAKEANFNKETTEDINKGTEKMETNDEQDSIEENISPKRAQRIFSVDDIINNIGPSTESQRSSVPDIPQVEEQKKESPSSEKSENEEHDSECRNAISVEDDNVILEIGGVWVQLNINCVNDTKVLSVVPLSEGLVIDVNGNYQAGEEEKYEETKKKDKEMEVIQLETNVKTTRSEDSEEMSQKLESEKQLMEPEVLEENIPNEEILQSENDLENQRITDDNHNETVPQEEVLNLDESLQKSTVTNECLQNHKDINVKSVKEDSNNSVENIADITDRTTEKPIEEIDYDHLTTDVFQSEVVIGEDHIDNDDVFLDLNIEESIEREFEDNRNEEDEEKKVVDAPIIREEKRKCEDFEDRKSSSKKSKNVERRNSEDRNKQRKKKENICLKDFRRSKSENYKCDFDLKKYKKFDKQLTAQVSVSLEDFRKKDEMELKKREKKLTPQSSLDSLDSREFETKEDLSKNFVAEEINKEEFDRPPDLLNEASLLNLPIEVTSIVEEMPELRNETEVPKSVLKETAKPKRLTVFSIFSGMHEALNAREETVKSKKFSKKSRISLDGATKLNKNEKKISFKEEDIKKELVENAKARKREKKLPSIVDKDEEVKKKVTVETIKVKKVEKKLSSDEPKKCDDTTITKKDKLLTVGESVKQKKSKDDSFRVNEETKPKITKEKDTIEEPAKKEILGSSSDVVQLAEKMIEEKQMEESKEVDRLPATKAAKKLYDSILSPVAPPQEPILKNSGINKQKSKLEETVNKIKLLKEKREDPRLKRTALKETKSVKVAKKVTFKLDTDVKEISRDEMDRKKLSWEEYSNRKRKTVDDQREETKIMEDAVTSSNEVVKVIPKNLESQWEEDSKSPPSPPKQDIISTNHKCIIDVNEFNIKPIESVCTPSPVSSSQFSCHSEDDSLQVYKYVVDSKLSSLNINIPKSRPKRVDRFQLLLERLNETGSLNYEELEELKKCIELKRKLLVEEERKQSLEERKKELNHFKTVPEPRKKRRFRNLYAEESSNDSDSSRSESGMGDYSVYQRDSQGVPKLIIKRNAGLPQPFVKLERSQAAELMVKKRKFY